MTVDLSPRNRIDQPLLPVTVVEIEHAGGVERLDHNQLLLRFFDRGGASPWLPLPETASVIDDAPAVIYRSYDVEIPLTVNQVAGLVGTELTPEEFRVLLDRYGSFFEIHDDFYDPETGEALQPKEIRHLANAQVTHVFVVSGTP